MTESPLKHATSTVQVFANGKGYLVGSIEGRCGVKNYDCQPNTNSLAGNKPALNDFNFKCHRKEDTNLKKAIVWSINGFTFNK